MAEIRPKYCLMYFCKAVMKPSYTMPNHAQRKLASKEILASSTRFAMSND